MRLLNNCCRRCHDECRMELIVTVCAQLNHVADNLPLSGNEAVDMAADAVVAADGAREAGDDAFRRPLALGSGFASASGERSPSYLFAIPATAVRSCFALVRN